MISHWPPGGFHSGLQGADAIGNLSILLWTWDRVAIGVFQETQHMEG